MKVRCLIGMILVLAFAATTSATTPDELRNEEMDGTSQDFAAVWEQPVSIVGLPGTYVRSPLGLPANAMISMTLRGADIGGGVFEGPYVRLLTATGAESGNYHAVPINPAIGFAFIHFISTDSTVQQTFIINRIQKQIPTKIQKLELREVLTNSFGPPFVMTRLGL